MSTPLDDELNTLLVYVVEIESANSAGGEVLAFMFGIYVLLFGVSTLVLRTRLTSAPATSSKAAKWLLFITILLFISTTLHFGSGLAAKYIQLLWPRAGKDEIQLTVIERLKKNNTRTLAPTQIFAVGQVVNIIIGDGVTIWRAYALWNRSPLTRIFLVVVYVLGSVICIVTYYLTNQTIAEQNFNTGYALVAAQLFSSFGVNLVATIAIGIKAWWFSKLWKSSGGRPGGAGAGNVLLFLLESGACFCLAQLIDGILVLCRFNDLDNLPLGIAESIMSAFSTMLAAMYPSIVIIILAYQKSVIEMSAASLRATPPSTWALSTSTQSTTSPGVTKEGIAFAAANSSSDVGYNSTSGKHFSTSSFGHGRGGGVANLPSDGRARDGRMGYDIQLEERVGGGGVPMV